MSTYERWSLVYLALCALVGGALLGYELRVVVGRLIDRYQERKRRPMATYRDRAYLLRKHLGRGLAKRAQTIRWTSR